MGSRGTAWIELSVAVIPLCLPARIHRFATFHSAADYRIVRARRENQLRHSPLDR
jgi:hypothetical protein